ncbi:hypothetical protein ACLOJK_037868 [Asimina triloba]
MEDEPKGQHRSGRLQERGRDRVGDELKASSVNKRRLHRCEVSKAPSVADCRLRCYEYSKAPSVASCHLRRCELLKDRVVVVCPLRHRYTSVLLNPDLHYSPLLCPTMHVATDDPCFPHSIVGALSLTSPFRNAQPHFEMPKQSHDEICKQHHFEMPMQTHDEMPKQPHFEMLMQPHDEMHSKQFRMDHPPEGGDVPSIVEAVDDLGDDVACCGELNIAEPQNTAGLWVPDC